MATTPLSDGPVSRGMWVRDRVTGKIGVIQDVTWVKTAGLNICVWFPINDWKDWEVDIEKPLEKGQAPWYVERQTEGVPAPPWTQLVLDDETNERQEAELLNKYPGLRDTQK